MTHSKVWLAIMLSAVLAGTVGGCRKKGPAERAGEEIDEAIDEVQDALDPKGPAEKAGEKIDDALD